MELILIRHGLPRRVHNTDGKPADPALAEDGIKQAGLMAQRFRPGSVDRLYVSPMQRAQQTAVPLAEQLNLPAEIEEGVAEFDRYAETYIPVEELKHLDPDEFQFPERNEDEVRAFGQVVVVAIEQIVANNPGKRVAIVCHGGVINVWAAHTIGLAEQFFFIPDYTSVNSFMAARSGERSIITLNDAVHLRGIQI
jgi:probable phosphoglycerate mutase